MRTAEEGGWQSNDTSDGPSVSVVLNDFIIWLLFQERTHLLN